MGLPSPWAPSRSPRRADRSPSWQALAGADDGARKEQAGDAGSIACAKQTRAIARASIEGEPLCTAVCSDEINPARARCVPDHRGLVDEHAVLERVGGWADERRTVLIWEARLLTRPVARIHVRRP